MDDSKLISTDSVQPPPHPSQLYADAGAEQLQPAVSGEWPLVGRSDGDSLGERNPAFVPVEDKSDVVNTSRSSDGIVDEDHVKASKKISIGEEETMAQDGMSQVIYMPPKEEVEDEVECPALTFDEMFDLERAEKFETHKINISRRQDWLAFQDYDSDSDMGEFMSQLPGGGPVKDIDEHYLNFGFICCPCIDYCIEKKLNRGI